MLDGVVETLQWTTHPRPEIAVTEAAYGSLVAKRLGLFLNDLDGIDPATSERLFDRLSAAEPAVLQRVITAPEATCRLFWGHPGRCDDRDLAQFLIDSLDLEGARDGRRPPETLARSTWSADGVARWDPGAATPVEQPRPAGLTVDCESPAAVCFDYSGLHGASMRMALHDQPGTRALALDKVERAMRGIDAVGGSAAGFVRHFTLVANLVLDTERPLFTSGSTGQYVGRSMLCNAHLPFVDAEIIADALVHESVHSLLYMDEIQHPWVLSDELFGTGLVTRSPWTGSPLPLRPFLQACFVWFALWNFWSRAQGSPGFAGNRVEECSRMARSGFLKAPLATHVEPYLGDIAPTVLRLLEQMQDLVTSAPVGAGPATG